jgi:hypothetical protein
VPRLSKEHAKKLGNLQVTAGENTMTTAALKLQDHQLLAKIGGEDLISKEIKFHHSCRKSYTNLSDVADDKTQTSPVYVKVKTFVQEHIVDNEGSRRLQGLLVVYTEDFESTDPLSSAQKLSERLQKEFSCIITTKLSNKQGILYNKVLSTETASRRANFDLNGLKEVAHYIRELIISTNRVYIVTPESLKDVKSNIPSECS